MDTAEYDFSYEDAFNLATIDEAIEGTEFFRHGNHVYNLEWFQGENPTWAFSEAGVPYKIETWDRHDYQT